LNSRRIKILENIQLALAFALHLVAVGGFGYDIFTRTMNGDTSTEPSQLAMDTIVSLGVLVANLFAVNQLESDSERGLKGALDKLSITFTGENVEKLISDIESQS
jgi:hypothetical protein